MTPLRRDVIYKLGAQGLQIGMYFAKEDPPGWYIGTILQTPVPKVPKGHKQSFWRNFTQGAEPEDDDDVKVFPTSLTNSTYKKEWVLLCKEGTTLK